MQHVVETREPLGHTYAEPPSGLRVSWGSVLAGWSWFGTWFVAGLLALAGAAAGVGRIAGPGETTSGRRRSVPPPATPLTPAPTA